MSKLTKTFAKTLVRVPGETRGVVFESDYKNIIGKFGIKSVSKVENRLKELGYPIKYIEIMATQSFPIGLRILSLLVIKEVFNLGDKDVELIGYDSPNLSLFVRLLARFFLSPEKLMANVGSFWRKHFTIGGLNLVNYDKKKREIVVEVTDFDVHPIYCVYFKGYAKRLTEYTMPGKKVTIKEINCSFKKGVNHRFLITWK